MDKTVLQATIALVGVLSGLIIPAQSAKAVTFGAQDLNQDQFIAIAVPLEQGDRYNLLILEQISTTRPCWREQGSHPVLVEPLLLNFDFTNLCGRSTDSNGYSLRRQGQDLALKYSLKIVKQATELVLVGVPHRHADGAVVEIGRTQGIGQGLHKILLDPGWRLTRRTYNGQPLGHLYLTQDQAVPGTPPLAPKAPLAARRLPPAAAIQIPVPPPGAAVAPDPRPQLFTPPAPRTPTDGRSPQFSPEAIPIPVPPPLSPSPLANPAPPAHNLGLLPVPSPQIPLGNSGDSPEIYASNQLFSSELGTPPPPPQAGLALGPRYRVVVEVSNATQQAQIRALVPGAFRSSYQGRSVIQVGSFQDRVKADEMIQIIESNGFNPILESLQ